MKRVLCVWLPDWPIQRLAAAGPERVNPAADRQALEQLAECCRQFSPVVGLEDSAAPDSLLLDVTDLGPLFGGEAALAEQVVRCFAQQGLEVRVAVADTIGAAWAVAHFGRTKDEGERTKDEGGKRKEEGLLGSSFVLRPFSFVLPPSSFLLPLPIEALRLPEKTIGLLHQLGIYRIGQLERLPRADLASRFGSPLVDRLDQAMGRLAEPIPAQPLPPHLEVERSLEYPTARQENIEAVLEQLIGRLASRLVCYGRGVVRLRCRLDCQAADPVEFSVGLFEPTTSARHLFQLVHMQLERLALPAPVSGVRVEAAATASFRRRQEELFSDGRVRQQQRHLADLIDRLSIRLGSRSVVRARRTPDAQPELAYCYDSLVEGLTQFCSDDCGRFSLAQAFTPGNLEYKTPSFSSGPLKGTRGEKRLSRGLSSPGVNARARKEGDRWQNLPLRPLRLLCRPVPVSTVSIVPDGPPVRFRLGNRQHQVAYTWGPERIETGWWRGRAVARDYYRVEIATGERFWVFRNLKDGRWFMHGMFE